MKAVFEKIQNQLPWCKNHSSGTVPSGSVRRNEYDLEIEDNLSIQSIVLQGNTVSHTVKRATHFSSSLLLDSNENIVSL